MSESRNAWSTRFREAFPHHFSIINHFWSPVRLVLPSLLPLQSTWPLIFHNVAFYVSLGYQLSSSVPQETIRTSASHARQLPGFSTANAAGPRHAYIRGRLSRVLLRSLMILNVGVQTIRFHQRKAAVLYEARWFPFIVSYQNIQKEMSIFSASLFMAPKNRPQRWFRLYTRSCVIFP